MMFLFTALFLLMMCLAEWLRRKWVDRENLAFPIVEVVDHTIRHDAEVEAAGDIRHPKKRKWMFNPLFGLGFLIGFVILGIEALGHYDILHSHHVMFFDVSDKVLMNSTTFREMNHVYFVVSPIVVGLLFLVSLEISFSVWVIFFIYMLRRDVGNAGQGRVPRRDLPGLGRRTVVPVPGGTIAGGEPHATSYEYHVLPRRYKT